MTIQKSKFKTNTLPYVRIDQLLNVSVAKDTAVNEDTPTPQPEGVLEALGVERMD
jgi:hypothetical protein